MIDVKKVGENYIDVCDGRTRRVEIPRDVGSYFLTRGMESAVQSEQTFGVTRDEWTRRDAARAYARDEVLQLLLKTGARSNDDIVNTLVYAVYPPKRR